MPLTNGTRLGPYEIISALGAGGMGEVYRARDTRLKRDVAIKVLPEAFAQDPDRLARFQREAELLATLNHPNIAGVYGLEKADGLTGLVLELVEGETLADLIRRGPVAISDALPIARQVAEALEAAHEQGIVHRDLKPANIKLTARGARPPRAEERGLERRLSAADVSDGTVKVLDFGLAKALDVVPAAGDLSDSPTMTSPAMTGMGVILGTAAYMSPEQAKGKPADKRSDIWAFGCVLHEMLTGKRAFEGEGVSDTLAAVLRSEPDWTALPASAPASIRTLVKRCLEKDRTQRLQAIGEARITIDETLNGTVREMEPQVEALRHRVRRLWPWVVATAVPSLAFAAVSFLHFREAPPQDRSVRFQVPPPEKSMAESFQLSPDGAYLALTGTEGARRLWVRPIDGLEAQALPGTDGASFPFWSPDSAFIGFFAQGKLKKISVTGGPAQTLCDAVQTRGGTWNSDGVILITPPNSVALYRVPSAGGVPTPVTKAGRGVSHRFPHFLPGGRRFLYTVTGNTPEANGVYVGSLDGTVAVRILPDGSRAFYVPPRPSGHTGYLVFTRDTTVMAQPFDLDRLQSTGDMFPLAQRVQSSRSGYPEFSVSENGALAYVSGERSLELIWMDRAGKPLDSAGPAGVYDDFRLSPDDTKVAFDRNLRDVWVLDMLRGVTSRLTSGPAFNNNPAWSPDGLRIFFPSNRSGGYDLYVKSATGAGQEEMLLRMSTPTGWGTDWSRDGRFILYQIPGAQTGQDLWVAPQFGDRKPFAYLQTPFNEQDGRFAPGPQGAPHWVAYVSDETGRDEVYVQAFPLSGEKKQASTGGGVEPIWRHDGTELFYVGADRNLMAVPIRAGTTVEAGVPKSLFPVRVSTSRRNYAVAGDGQRFLVSRAVGDVPPITVVVNWQSGLAARETR